MNLLHDHPSPEVRAGLLQLLDALTSWNRNTGRSNVVIVKDTAGGEWRSLDGAPVPADVSDAHLLDTFEQLHTEQQ